MNNILKYILAAVALVSVSAVSYAQDSAGAIMKSMATAVNALGDYSVSFKLTAEGNVIVGEYTVSRDRYSLNFADAEVYSDGRVRYEINHADDEILIDALDPDDRDILSNPTKFFDFADDEFNASSGGSSTIGGKSYNVIYLTPRNRDSSIKNVELLIDRATNLPNSISYAAEGLSGYIVVEILKIGSAGRVPDSLFTPDMNLYKGYEVIDFR